MLPKMIMQNAAEQVRAADAALTAIVAELQDAGVWSGSDADRFQREWNDLVRAPLHAAAVKLDLVSFVTL